MSAKGYQDRSLYDIHPEPAHEQEYIKNQIKSTTEADHTQ